MEASFGIFSKPIFSPIESFIWRGMTFSCNHFISSQIFVISTRLIKDWDTKPLRFFILSLLLFALPDPNQLTEKKKKKKRHGLSLFRHV